MQVLSTRLELARLVSHELVQQKIVRRLLQQAEKALQVELPTADTAFVPQPLPCVHQQSCSKTWHAFQLQEKTGQAVSWFGPDGTLDVKLFASALKRVEDQALRQALVRLKNAEVMSVTDLEEHLLLCRGPGIMCAVAAAVPHLYLEGSSVSSAVA